MKTIKSWLATNWVVMALHLLALAFLCLLLWFQLGGLLPGLSQAEVVQTEAVSSFGDIRANPLNFPYKIMQFVFSKLPLDIPATRLASSVVGLVVASSFFFILRNWYTRRVAMLGTLLLICSAWFLHTSRTGTDNIMHALLIMPVAATVWSQKSRRGQLATIASLIMLVVLMYIPGMIWFVVPLAFWQWGRITRLLRRHRPSLLILLLFTGFVLFAPLVLTLVVRPELIKAYLGLPETFPSIADAAKNLVSAPLELFFRGPDNPAFWLGRTALLSWFGAVMFVIGVYAYFFKRKLDRTWFIAYVFIAGTMLTALGGPVSISVLLPFVYLIITGGIALMLQQWFTVFPRNPLARNTGAVLMSLAVLLACFYGINHYFIAWPNAPETKGSYQSADSP